MKRSVARSPYVWTLVAVIGIVIVAWIGRERYRPVLAGTVAPEFELARLGADEVRLTDYRGKVVLVNVWATWCGPCVQEMPSMQRLYQAMEGEDFEILAVSVDAGIGVRDGSGNLGGDVEAFVQRFGLTFPILRNPSGDIQRQYQTTGVPESFLLDKNGTIVKKVAGRTEWDSKENQELIRRLLAA